MLSAKPTGLLSSSFVVARDGHALCVLEQPQVREKATVMLGGALYQMENQLLGRDFLLRQNGRLLARANKRTFRRAFDVDLDPEAEAPRGLAFASSGSLGRGRFVLSEGGREVGRVQKTMFGRSARASFEVDLSEPTQVFLLWIGLMMWRRDRN